jgi:uncharacterized protein (TIGR02145 family)
MKAKRFLPLVAVCAVLLVIFACSSKSDEDNNDYKHNNDGYNNNNNNGNHNNDGYDDNNNNSYCGGVVYNPSTQFCSNSQIFSKCNGKEYNLTTQHCTDGILYTNFTDTRDGKTYKTVEIGSQTWMAENLNYVVSGSAIYCYMGNSDNCKIYGILYDWSTAMALASSYNSTAYGTTTIHKGICPTGWHLPSDDEWEELRYFVGTSAGTKLKAKSGWNSGGNGTDIYGFAALPGGYCAPLQNGNCIVASFNEIGNYGIWWTATEYNASHSRSNTMNKNESSIIRYGDDKSDYSLAKSYKVSVRCVKDY